MGRIRRRMMLELEAWQPRRLNLCILACTKCAEVYSMVRAIGSRRADLELKITAVGFSAEIVECAARGIH